MQRTATEASRAHGLLIAHHRVQTARQLLRWILGILETAKRFGVFHVELSKPFQAGDFRSRLCQTVNSFADRLQDNNLFWFDALDRCLNVPEAVRNATELGVEPGLLIGSRGPNHRTTTTGWSAAVIIGRLWKDQEWAIGHALPRVVSYSLL